ncbi:MAG: PQQ-binding-like beta-propeller repeat protein, partial [Thermoplasmata archaeon]|nr:PQQ-binding-like beta-propeller repeat protein [Thermoplasmata archaeon]
PLVLFGTADPDAAVYAIDAATGVEVWRFQTYNPGPGAYDVGAGVTISPPGALGFPHGVAYVPNKYGMMYALDLSTGKQIWSVNFNKIAGTVDGGRSTAALQGENLVFGFSRGVFDLYATTGGVLWQYNDTAKVEALSSPAIVGPQSRAVVAVGDLAGGLDVVSLATGKQLYRYQTGGYVTASPAVFGGNVILCSTDGFLYDFAVGGGNDAMLPTTAISSPSDGATLPNPNGNVSVTGTAADAHGVGAVFVAVESSGTGGPWWNSATGTWVPGPMANSAALNRSTNGTTAAWTFSYPAPSAGGTYEFRAYATSASGQSDLRGAFSGFTVNFSAKGPHLRSTNGFIAPGASTTVLGGGFGHGENVTVQLAGATLATRTTTATGYLPAFTLHVPTNAAFGLTSLVATGISSGKSAIAAIVIGNSWDQTGYAPSHLDYEANDGALDHLITPGNRSWVDLAWHFHAGTAINASPAVVDGVAYVADTVGELYAVDIHNGGFLWSWTDPTGAAINGSPAVDPSLGRVFVAANDGFVYALASSTGTFVWKVSVGGELTAPVYSGGELYIASSNGTVGAFAETNGSAAWTVSLSGPVRAAPTLDSARDRLFVGDTRGDLVALNSSTGAHNWTYLAGGGIFGSVTVYGSRVYFGSADGNITCVLESTGGKVWAYQTGGPVTGAGALSHLGTVGWTNLELLVGSGDGYIYAINASAGSLNYALAVGSPVVGVSAAEGVVAFTAASGLVGGARTYTNLTVWGYHTTAGLGSAPVIIDGTIFVGAEDGYLYAFTPYGQPPV